MSVEQAQIIDSVGIDNDSQSIVLTISDHLDWSEPEYHTEKLQDKLNAYLDFCESGELYEKYPKALRSMPIILSIITKFDLSEEGVSFIEAVRPIVEDAGFTLKVKKLHQRSWLSKLFKI